MVAYEKVKRIILETDDPAERKVRFMALLTSSLPKTKRKPILSGGSAVEVYLDGMLRTGGMNVVYLVEPLVELLKEWHFERGGLRSWANDELGLAVDAVGETLNGSYERTTTITTDNGPATIIGVEDLVLKRLASAKHWRVPSDIEQAYLLARAHRDRMDWNYVEEEAGKAYILDYLEKLKEMLGAKTE